ncbi:MAG: type VII secretion protein EssC [Actinobacteria bacterium]|nr:type VII secretion protein EssC [Actinomycetota bacterium]
MDRLLLQVYFNDNFIEFDLEKFEGKKLNIGKNPSNEIFIDSDFILDLHAYLEIYDDKIELVDQSNGYSFIGGKPINEVSVKPGDRVFLTSPSDLSKGVNILVNDKSKYYGQKIKYNIAEKTLIKIGRDKTNEISIDDLAVSGNHAEIIKYEGNFYIRDCDSKNGTYLNGKKIKEAKLRSGDLITLSGYRIIFQNDYIVIEFLENCITVNGLSQIREIKIEYPYFLPSPRFEPILPSGEIEIPNPPPMISKPNISWLPIILPPIGMIIAMAVIGIVMWRSTQNPYIILGTSSMGVISLIVSFITYYSQKKKYIVDEKKRKEKYFEVLNIKESEIKKVYDLQKQIMGILNPDIKECIRIVQKKENRLWERGPANKDFLLLRLGIGDLPFNVKITLPKQTLQIEQDILLNKAIELQEKYSHVKQVPICISLVDAGTVGVIGKRESILQAARQLIIQAATHHSYEEVKLVIIFPEKEIERWKWVRWLPHVWNDDKKIRFLAINKEMTKNLFNYFYDIIRLRNSLTNSENKDSGTFILPYYIFIIADRTLVENELLMEYLIQNNQKNGLSAIFLFEKMQFLPKECRFIINLESDFGNLLDRTGVLNNYVFLQDKISVDDAEIFSRTIAPIKIRKIVTSSEIPGVISFLDLYNVKNIEDLKVMERWISNEPYKSLAVPIGLRSVRGKMILDIHDKKYGPHGLIAGTTGSGKSELLQTFILSIAINFHPNYVAFLLIDYKGGSMAQIFRDLPHIAGIITNLGGNQTLRALLSIKSELKRRQLIFDSYQVNHIDKYQMLYKNGKTKEPLPHLIIIVDEFAELKSEQPEFMSELVSTARLGRSLGVHLILATQKPSGIVDDQIWSNSKFRICLKVQDIQDSREVIKRPDAAYLTIPGRAFIQVGNNEVFELFQSAYSGAEYKPISNDVEVNQDSVKTDNIYRVMIDGSRALYDIDEYSYDFREDLAKSEKSENLNQLEALVNYLKNLTKKQNIKRTNQQWLPPLPEKIALVDIINNKSIGNYEIGWNGKSWNKINNWLSPIVGILDDPANQSQKPLLINFEKEGNLVVYGSPGSGKTTFLQSLMMSLCLLYSPEDINIYILDFATRLLNIFSGLPHVGDILMVDEKDKLQKLMHFILKELNKRKNIFTEKGVGSLKAYIQSISRDIPAIFIIVDNFAAITELYPDIYDQFIQISREGANLGIHFVFTANNQLGVGYRIYTNIKMAIALQMLDKAAYVDVVGNTYGMEPENVKGRGLVRGNPPLEFQCALPVEGETEFERTVNIKEKVNEINKNWDGVRARSVPIMPEILYQTDELVKASGNPFEIPIGVDFQDLETRYLSILEIQNFLVAGRVQSGKTNFLKLIIRHLINSFDKNVLDLYIIDSIALSLIEFKDSGFVKEYITDGNNLNRLIKKIGNELESRRKKFNKERISSKRSLLEKDFMSKFKPLFIFIDDCNDFFNLIGADERKYLENIIARYRFSGIHLFLSGLVDDLNFNYDGIIKIMKSLQEGILFCDINDQQVFNIKISYMDSGEVLRPGEGYLIKKGTYKRLKICFCN